MAIPISYYKNQGYQNKIKDEEKANKSTELEFENDYIDDVAEPNKTIKDMLSKYSSLKHKTLEEYGSYQHDLLHLIESDSEDIVLENFLNIYEKLFDNIDLQFKYDAHLLNNLAFKEHLE